MFAITLVFASFATAQDAATAPAPRPHPVRLRRSINPPRPVMAPLTDEEKAKVGRMTPAEATAFFAKRREEYQHKQATTWTGTTIWLDEDLPPAAATVARRLMMPLEERLNQQEQAPKARVEYFKKYTSDPGRFHAGWVGHIVQVEDAGPGAWYLTVDFGPKLYTKGERPSVLALNLVYRETYRVRGEKITLIRSGSGPAPVGGTPGAIVGAGAPPEK